MKYCTPVQYHIQSISCRFNLPPRPLITTDIILYKVCKAYQITADDITGPSKQRGISDARHIIAHLIRKHFPAMKDAEIATIINRDRTTVIMSVRAAKDLLKTDESFKNRYMRIQRTIRTSAKQAI